MDDAQAIDELITRVVLSSEHGAEWFRQRAERMEFARRLTRLHQRGLSTSLAANLRDAGSVALLEQIEALSPSGIAALNEAAA